jgi:TatD DNase family protein
MNKPLIFDTHCHLADEEYQSQDIKSIIQAAEQDRVKFILNVGESKKSNQKVIEQLAEFPNLFAALGLHPNSNEDLEEENLN